TYDELKQRLQKENHSLWLKSVSGDRGTTSRDGKIRVRKRKRADASGILTDSPCPASRKNETPEKPTPLHAHARKVGPAFRPQVIEKPVAGKPWKSVADGTEPFNRKKNVFDSVLRRCGMCCEHCGQAIAANADPESALKPFYIQPLSEGGEHSIKNMVALCPACLEAVQKDPSPKTIKDLKRKTRSKLYDSLQVIHKKTAHKRRSQSGRRQTEE
ncbi:HNH endonuclease, partial [Desulfococcus sp.]|uniref:HNH endonuclease n=1 Tax=Desulfococcus sp. TaxID=2025834 RepID=UPI003D0FF01E